MLFLFLGTDFVVQFFKLPWLNAHLTKIWPFVNEVFDILELYRRLYEEYLVALL
ncbi:hypothetical protein Hanom_Chr05g00467581 [Helianthus anomalus]